MQPSTNAPLKVLTPVLAERLRKFNEASRALQKLGVRLHRFEPTYNRLSIDAKDGRMLLAAHLVCGYQRQGTAGSTSYSAIFQGVEVVWSEPISYRDYASPTHPIDLTFH